MPGADERGDDDVLVAGPPSRLASAGQQRAGQRPMSGAAAARPPSSARRRSRPGSGVVVGASADVVGGASADGVAPPKTAGELLAEVLASGECGPDKARRLRASLERLEACVGTAREREQAMLQKAKGLNQNLQLQRVQLDKQGELVLEDTSETGDLRRELIRASNELAVAAAAESDMQSRVERLREEHGDVAREFELAKQSLPLNADPEVTEVKGQVARLRDDVADTRARAERMQAEVHQVTAAHDEAARGLETCLATLETTKQQLVVSTAEPVRIGKQIHMVANADRHAELQLGNTQQAAAKLDADLADLRRRQQDAASLADELGAEHLALAGNLHGLQTAGQEAHHRHETAMDTRTQLASDKAAAAIRLKRATKDTKAEKQTLGRLDRARAAALVTLKQTTVQSDQLVQDVATANTKRAELQRQVEAAQREVVDLSQAVPKAMGEVEKLQRVWESSDNMSADHLRTMQRASAATEAVNKELGTAAQEASDLTAKVKSMQQAVARAATERLRAHVKLEKATNQAHDSGVAVSEAAKQFEQAKTLLRETEQMYSLVKNERTKITTQITAAEQRVEESREKLKVMRTEVEILRATALERDAKFQRRKRDKMALDGVTGALRAEYNQLLQKNQELVHQKKSVTTANKSLLEQIDDMEGALLDLRQRFKRAVQDRNTRAAKLVQRHDDLCHYHEKSNMLDASGRRADMEMKDREEEIQCLKLEVTELKRDIQNAAKKKSLKKTTEEELVAAQISLLEWQDKVRELETALCDPDNTSRWRELRGVGNADGKRDLTPAQLEAKAVELERRLAAKEAQSLEKDLVLDETTRLVERAASELGAGRQDTMQLGQLVNEFQGKLKDTNRKLMAAVSELSMYRSEAMQLQRQVDDNQVAVVSARDRLKAGQPPTEAAAREWTNHVRQRARERTAAQQAAMTAAHEPQDLADGRRSFAAPRANAYVPDAEDALPLPKPFLSAPFKPAETMPLHMRRLSETTRVDQA
eukprot:m.176266 g.176266  ORF g.176266 m.176266 type:complete len:996 (-) comp17938_c1_seq2:15-3002(-)